MNVGHLLINYYLEAEHWYILIFMTELLTTLFEVEKCVRTRNLRFFNESKIQKFYKIVKSM